MAVRTFHSFKTIAEVIGEDAALQLSLAFRGLRIYILKSYNDQHPVVRAIGRSAADQLAEYFAGSSIDIPSTPGLKAEVFRLADAGILTRDEIAAQLYIGRRQVYRWLESRDAQVRRDGQFNLFAA
jgi:Helix-turn-helix domain